MALSLADAELLAQNAEFQGRVKQAAVNYSGLVSNEAPTTKNTVDSKRNTLAKNVLNDAQGYMIRFTNAVIQSGNPLTTPVPTDTEIINAIVVVWNPLAGVTPAEMA